MSSILVKKIHASNYEQYLLKLAEALNGYFFYLPAFRDLRGLNYRFGPLHFHERDLVRSLIIFAEPGLSTDFHSKNPVEEQRKKMIEFWCCYSIPLF